jgi:hypothetical protein
VKGLLHRLQEMPAEPTPADPRPAELNFRRGYLIGIATTTTVIVMAAVVMIFGLAYVLTGFEPQATSTPKDGPSRQPASSKVSDAPGVVTAPAALPEGPLSAATTVSPAVEAAQALMSAGRVQAARQQLLAMVSDGSPNVPWALARSYDPNYLETIEGADAGPDVVEATRWYRAWHAAAVKQGMITDSVSLEKIIRSMQR